MMDINVDLLQWFIGGTVKNENISNKEFAVELHKPIIKTSKKGKVHSTFINNI